MAKLLLPLLILWSASAHAQTLQDRVDTLNKLNSPTVDGQAGYTFEVNDDSRGISIEVRRTIFKCKTDKEFYIKDGNLREAAKTVCRNEVDFTDSIHTLNVICDRKLGNCPSLLLKNISDKSINAMLKSGAFNVFIEK